MGSFHIVNSATYCSLTMTPETESQNQMSFWTAFLERACNGTAEHEGFCWGVHFIVTGFPSPTFLLKTTQNRLGMHNHAWVLVWELQRFNYEYKSWRMTSWLHCWLANLSQSMRTFVWHDWRSCVLETWPRWRDVAEHHRNCSEVPEDQRPMCFLSYEKLPNREKVLNLYWDIVSVLSQNCNSCSLIISPVIWLHSRIKNITTYAHQRPDRTAGERTFWKHSADAGNAQIS